MPLITDVNADFEQLFLEAAAKLSTAAEAAGITQKEQLQIFHMIEHMENNKQCLLRDLQEGSGLIVCSVCGSLSSTSFTNKADLIMHDQCFSCNLWADRAANMTDRTIIVDGTMYTDSGRKADNSAFLGFGGAEFTIQKGDKQWSTNNLWCGGDVPFFFRTLLPNNASFVKPN